MNHLPWGIVGIYTMVLLIICNVLFMVTRVSTECVYVRFGWLFPMYVKRIPVQNIREARAITYRPILEAGGWGIRGGRIEGERSKVLNARGNEGVLLQTEKIPILIGSQQSADLLDAVQKVIA
jgi:hypothetical protein